MKSLVIKLACIATIRAIRGMAIKKVHLEETPQSLTYTLCVLRSYREWYEDKTMVLASALSRLLRYPSYLHSIVL